MVSRQADVDRVPPPGPQYMELHRAYCQLKDAVAEFRCFIQEMNGENSPPEETVDKAGRGPSLVEMVRELPQAINEITEEIRNHTARLRDVFF